MRCTVCLKGESFIVSFSVKIFLFLFFSLRGNDFRPKYLKIAKLRAIFSVPFLCLSATVNSLIFENVKEILCFNSPATIARTPDHPNIFLEIIRQPSFDVEEFFSVFANQITPNFQKTIIYADSIKTVAFIYDVLLAAVGEGGRRSISMFHAEIGDIMNSFHNPQSEIRVLVSTVASGMGVEIRDIRHVIHWGKCHSMLQFWQEVGRAGRDAWSITCS